MPGRVVRVLVAAGDRVGAGQPLVVVEAMKMENELRAPADGVVTKVGVEAGAAVDTGAVLIVIE
jgi:biotin carboxyl carrier protein